MLAADPMPLIVAIGIIITFVIFQKIYFYLKGAK